jgi:hypothetical protein
MRIKTLSYRHNTVQGTAHYDGIMETSKSIISLSQSHSNTVHNVMNNIVITLS